MYKHSEKQMILSDDFFLPFGGKLNKENRWCKLAQIIPWDVIEEKYIKNFKNTTGGNEALSVRYALGSLIIQAKESLSDKQLLVHISENPYMQYFIGLQSFKQEEPFHHSLLVTFRKRLGKDIINEVNELIAKVNISDDDENDSNEDKPSNDSDKDNPSSKSDTSDDKNENSGKLILDATCVPADIHYPTDIWLLNTTREALEEIIDVLHKPYIGERIKPRTYRRNARKDFMNLEKKRRKSKKEIRKGIGKQLRYIERDLKIIENFSKESSFKLLNKKQYKNLLVSTQIYKQQLEMYQNKTHKIEDRIVSLYMPFIRPIVRGKTNAPVEFGAKLSVSVVNGYTFMEEVKYDAYNESTTLQKSIEDYKRKFGFYPKAVIADKIYRNRKNLKYCKRHNIRISGPPLGRPTSDKELYKEQRKQEVEDSKIRNSVEGKFGEAKRAYGLNRLFTRLKETSETVIALNILVMNLEKRLRVLFVQFLKRRIGATNFNKLSISNSVQ